MRYKDPWHKWKLLLAYAWGMPWMVIGLVLCGLVLTVPLAVIPFAIGGYPLYRTHQTFERKRALWQNTLRPTSDETPPWLIETAPEPWLSDETEPDA